MSKLYELTENYNNLLELLDNPEVPEDMVKQGLESIEDNIKIKAENYAKIIKILDGEANTIDEEIKRLTNLKKTKNNNITRLKDSLFEGLQAVGIKTVKGTLFTISIQKNPASVDVIDNSKIPTTYFIQQEPTLDKTLLLKDLKSGKEVEGAVIKQGERLSIK
jgi:uncharacterized protein (DUF1778 family)